MNYLNKLVSSQGHKNISASRNRLVDEDDDTQIENDTDVNLNPNYGSYINKGMESIDSESSNYEVPTSLVRDKKATVIELTERVEIESELSSISEYKSSQNSQRKAKKITTQNANDDNNIVSEILTEKQQNNEETSDSKSSDSEFEDIKKQASAEIRKDKEKSTKNRKKIASKKIAEEDDFGYYVKPSKIIALHIMQCEFLKNDWFLQNVYVKIHLQNIKTKELLVDNSGLTTKSFDFLKNGTMVAQWNEIIMFEECLVEKTKNPTNLIVFLELLEKKDKETGDYSIAWAFIKPIGYKGASNMNKILKLQLYEIDQEESIFELWKSDSRKPYPSTIIIKIRSVELSEASNEINEIKYSFHQNTGFIPKCNSTFGKLNSKSDNVQMKKKIEGQASKIPNQIFSLLQNVEGETTVLKFNKIGSHLAISAKKDKKYIIIIYKIPQLHEEIRLFHHKGIIYEICWNMSGNKLITSSADSTVTVWTLAEANSYTRQSLAHSSFVYSAKFCIANENLIVSGGYDKLIRIWNSENNEYVLSDKMSGHSGFINSICFLENVEIFFSGDSLGIIHKWARGKTGWLKIMEIKNVEFTGKMINELILLPGGQRLLVILRNNAPWTMNIANSAPATCYKDGLNNKYQNRSCASPCGSLIFVGNNVWKASNGELHATYDPNIFDHHPIMCADFHPHYDMIAFGSGCKNSPVILLNRISNYNKSECLGLELYSSEFVESAERQNNYNNINYEEGEKRTFKDIGERIRNDVKSKQKNHKNKEFKLWNLLKKMDSVLYNAKNRENNINRYDFSPEETDKWGQRATNVGMTEFYNRFKKGDDPSEGSDTYTVENEVVPAVAKLNFARGIRHEIVESTTSDVESIEEDLNTYTITPNK